MKLPFYIFGLISGIVLSYLVLSTQAPDTPAPVNTPSKSDSLGTTEAPALSNDEIDNLIQENLSLHNTINKQQEVMKVAIGDIARKVFNKSLEVGSLQNKIDKLELKLSEITGENYSKEDKEKDPSLLIGKRKYIMVRLKQYRAILELTPYQEEQIGEWEWEHYLAHKRGESFPNKVELIKSILTDDELKIYEQDLRERDKVRTERSSSYRLAKYPVTLNLSEEQKDAIFENLHKYADSKTRAHIIIERRNEEKYKEFEPTTRVLIWAAEDVISDEQMEVFVHSLERSK